MEKYSQLAGITPEAIINHAKKLCQAHHTNADAESAANYNAFLSALDAANKVMQTYAEKGIPQFSNVQDIQGLRDEIEVL
ncbi:MAG: hypothetical protein FWE45_03100 [Firmicutes bacterium]|nr:hypothetical protein [Bacillota bacterium]